MAYNRNTPTSVGKTIPGNPLAAMREKHPHERGEDDEFATFVKAGLETPPRAWGRPAKVVTVGLNYGNTPTSVGKT